jgi:protein-tyrosine phosphatase
MEEISYKPKFERFGEGEAGPGYTRWARFIQKNAGADIKPCRIGASNLFIGSIASAMNDKELAEDGITWVLTVGDNLLQGKRAQSAVCSRSSSVQANDGSGSSDSDKEREQLEDSNKRNERTQAILSRTSGTPEYTRAVLRLRDTAQEILVDESLDAALDFVREALETGHGVLVHCEQGVSRSVSVVCAYLVLREGFNFEDALDLVRKTRQQARPNLNFATQLRAVTKGSSRRLPSAKGRGTAPADSGIA